MKKLSLLILLSAIIFSPVKAEESCGNYSDISPSDWYCNDIAYLKERKILTPKDQFYPLRNLNRAEALKVLFKTAGEREKSYKGNFFDVGNDWFSPYFYTSYAMGYIQSEDQKLEPAKAITKSEFTVLMMRVFEIEPGAPCSLPEEPSFNQWVKMPDIDLMGYICKAADLGIVTKDYGNQVINRATAMVILKRAISK